MQQIKDLQNSYRWVVWAAFKYLAATTAVTVWQVSEGFSANLPAGLQLPARIVAIIAMFLFIDAGLEAQAKYVFRGWMESATRKAGQSFLILSTVIFGIRFAATTFTTYVAAVPMAGAIFKAPDVGGDLAAIQSAQGQKQSNVKALKAEKQRLEQTEKYRVRDAEKRGKAIIDAAINAQGSRIAELYRSRNSWLLTDRKFKKYRESIEAAKVQAAGLVIIEKQQTKEAGAAYLAALSGKDEISAAIAGAMSAKVKDHAETKSGLVSAIYVLDFIAAFVAFALLLTICAYEKRYNVEYKSEFSAVFDKVGGKIKDDVLQNIEGATLAGWELLLLPFEKIPVFLKWITALIRVKLIGQLELMLKIDIDGNGIIGNSIPAQTPTNPADLIPKVGRNQIGFSVNRSAQKVGENPPISADLKDRKSTDVGLTPTLPTFEPTFEKIGSAKLPEKVGEPEPPNTDLPKHKIPTISRRAAAIKSDDRANRSGEIDKMADAARAAFKRYLKDNDNSQLWNTWKEWQRTLEGNGFTVVTSPGVTRVTIIKPKPEKKPKPRKK